MLFALVSVVFACTPNVFFNSSRIVLSKFILHRSNVYMFSVINSLAFKLSELIQINALSTWTKCGMVSNDLFKSSKFIWPVLELCQVVSDGSLGGQIQRLERFHYKVSEIHSNFQRSLILLSSFCSAFGGS